MYLLYAVFGFCNSFLQLQFPRLLQSYLQFQFAFLRLYFDVGQNLLWN
jgi:hypothetical protein